MDVLGIRTDDQSVTLCARPRAARVGAVVAPCVLALVTACGPVSAPGHPTTAKVASTNCTVPVAKTTSAATIPAAWTSSGDVSGNGSPFSLDIGDPQGLPASEAGQPVPLALWVSHSGKDSLAAPLPLRVCIYAAQQQQVDGVATWVDHGAPVWSFTPPPLTPAQSNAATMLSFSWNPTDAKGHALPPGVYFAQLAFPAAIHYAAGGQTHTEVLPRQANLAAGQYLAQPVFLGGPNPQPPMNPQIRALASLWDKTLYVPSTVPGNPPPSVTTIPPAPGMPRALISFVTFGASYQTGEDIPLGSQPSQAPDSVAALAKEPNAKLIDVTVAGVNGPVHAIVYGSSGVFQVDFNMGKAGLMFQAFGFTEAQTIAAARDWTPVVPVEPS